MSEQPAPRRLDDERLTEERWASIASRHQPDTEGSNCLTCRESWPCDAATAIRECVALTAERDRLRADLAASREREEHWAALVCCYGFALSVIYLTDRDDHRVHDGCPGEVAEAALETGKALAAPLDAQAAEPTATTGGEA